MRCLWILAAIAILSGCSSEVDKCVESQVKVWKIKEQRKLQQISEYETKHPAKPEFRSAKLRLAEDLGLIPTLDRRSIEEVEADERIRCMRIVFGK